MKIGLTYDLRQDYLKLGFSDEETAEFDRPDTIDAIEGALRQLGHSTERIGNIWRLTERLAAGARWDLVFNICEGLYGIGREAQVPALLEAYKIPVTFSDSVTMAVTLHKGMTKRLVRDAGAAPTADFAEVRSLDDIRRIDLPYPLFAKPIAEGTSKGITGNSKLNDRAGLERVCTYLLDTFPGQPVLVETYLPGREFTVGIFGTGAQAKVAGTVEILMREGAEKEVYTYENKERCEALVDYVLVSDGDARKAERVALDVWRALGCRDAGRVDVRLDTNGVAHFLEVNPLSGLHPEHSDLPIICTRVGIPYLELIRRIVDSAVERVDETATAFRGPLKS